MPRRGPRRLGKTARIHIEVYPELDEAIRRVCDERDIGIGDFISSCVARELNMTLPDPRERKPPGAGSEQMALADA